MELAKAHWVRPELVAEITYLNWPEERLLRHTVFVGVREDKPAIEVQARAAGLVMRFFNGCQRVEAPLAEGDPRLRSVTKADTVQTDRLQRPEGT